MQHIGVSIVKEDNSIVEKSDLNYAEIYARILTLEDWKNFQWVSSINPYGDTYLNFYQTSHFIDDLKKIADVLPDIKEKIDLLIEFSQKLDQQLQLKFIGD